MCARQGFYINSNVISTMSTFVSLCLPGGYDTKCYRQWGRIIMTWFSAQVYFTKYIFHKIWIIFSSSTTSQLDKVHFSCWQQGRKLKRTSRKEEEWDCSVFSIVRVLSHSLVPQSKGELLPPEIFFLEYGKAPLKNLPWATLPIVQLP